MELEIKNLNIQLSDTKSKEKKSKYFHVIKDLNLKQNSCEFIGVLGRSGSGKTTLLKALYGILPNDSITSGEILVNGQKRSHKSWYNFAACVYQDDAAYGDFTVEYTLRQSGIFRLMRGEKNSNIVNNEKSYESRVEERLNILIRSLEIEKCRNTLMKNVSGGERRRVMIGIELMARPKIIFLDEPTTGLDSLTGLKVMKFLKEISLKEKITVFCNIHIPTTQIFSTMDRAILLHKGRIIFNGKTEDIEEFFSNLGVAKIEDVSYPEMLIQLCTDDFDYNKYNLNENNPNFEIVQGEKMPEKVQVKKNEGYFDKGIDFYHAWILMKRDFKIMPNDRKNYFITILQYLIYLFILIGPSVLPYFNKTAIKTRGNDLNRLKNILTQDKTYDEDKENHIENINRERIRNNTIIRIIIIVFQMINVSQSMDTIGLNILSKEISAGFYTAGSLYFSYFAKFTIIAFSLNTVSFILQYFINKELIVLKITPLLHFFSIIVSTIIGLFIGSVTKSKVGRNLLSQFFMLLIHLDKILFVYKAKNYICNNFSEGIFANIITKIIEIVAISFPFFSNDGIISNLFEGFRIKNCFEVDEGMDLLDQYFFKLFHNRYFFLDIFNFNMIGWIIIFIVNIGIWILLTIYIRGKRLASNNRLVLQKNR